MVKCSGLNKPTCNQIEDCDWVRTKGCIKRSRRRVRTPPRNPKCSKKNKATCQDNPNCNWIVGKGCKKGSPRRSRSPVLPQCYKVKKTDCIEKEG